MDGILGLLTQRLFAAHNSIHSLCAVTQLSKGQVVPLKSYDRVVMGTDITLFIDPKNLPKVRADVGMHVCGDLWRLKKYSWVE